MDEFSRTRCFFKNFPENFFAQNFTAAQNFASAWKNSWKFLCKRFVKIFAMYAIILRKYCVILWRYFVILKHWEKHEYFSAQNSTGLMWMTIFATILHKIFLQLFQHIFLHEILQKSCSEFFCSFSCTKFCRAYEHEIFCSFSCTKLAECMCMKLYVQLFLLNFVYIFLHKILHNWCVRNISAVVCQIVLHRILHNARARNFSTAFRAHLPTRNSTEIVQ